MALGPVDIVVRYVQRGAGLPDDPQETVSSQRQGSLDRRMLLPCANPACKKGGFFLRPKVDRAVADGEAALELEVGCSGYVGALRTERGPAERCQNRVTASVEIVYPRPRGGS